MLQWEQLIKDDDGNDDDDDDYHYYYYHVATPTWIFSDNSDVECHNSHNQDKGQQLQLWVDIHVWI